MQHEGWGSPTLTPGGRGYGYSLFPYLRWYLKTHPPQNNEPVPFKISFDNASITSNRKVKAETGVIEDLRDASKKHEKGCHFVIYLGKEDREELMKELENVAQEIEKIMEDGKIELEDKSEVKVKIYLVCDLVALCQLLGLTAVYHPKAFWKCAWCLVTKDSITDFTHESWPLRDFLSKEARAMGEKASKSKSPKTFARKHDGIMVRSSVFGRRKHLLSSSTLRGNRCFDFHFISCHLACFMYSWLSHAK
jgi:hypothetical protein